MGLIARLITTTKSLFEGKRKARGCHITTIRQIDRSELIAALMPKYPYGIRATDLAKEMGLSRAQCGNILRTALERGLLKLNPHFYRRYILVDAEPKAPPPKTNHVEYKPCLICKRPTYGKHQICTRTAECRKALQRARNKERYKALQAHLRKHPLR